MRKTGRGITIVSLVVTIIILLILATVSIQSLTHTGMFASANKAKLDTKRSQISEWLGLEVISEQTNNPTGSAEQIINQTHKNVLDKQEELKRFGKDIKVEDVSTEEDGEQVDVYFYVVVDKDIYKVDLKNHKFIGELGKMLPVIKIVSISNTTNSIKVKVKTSRNEGGIVEYYIKSEDDTRYTLKATKNDDSEYVYDNLIQGKKYSVKVVAKAENGQSAEAIAEQTTGTIINLKEGDLEFTSKPSTWTNTDVEVTVKANIDIKGYQLLTSQNPDKGWNKATSQIFKTNGIIYAVLSDGVNYGVAASRTIQNIDKTKPVVTGATATTNKIAITATDEASGIIGYAVTTSNTEPSSFTDVASTKTLSVAPTGYKQGTTYYVWVKDEAGNVSESETVTTLNVTGTINFGAITWAGGKASTTIGTNTSYTIQYQVNSTTGTWKTGTSVNGLVHGDKVYARLWDGTNGGTSFAINNILDGINPSVNINLSATEVTTEGAITATVTQSDSESGINIGSCKWIYNTTAGNIGTNASSYTGTFTSANQNITLKSTTVGTYYLHVLSADNAGNLKETIKGPIAVKTASNAVPGSTTHTPSAITYSWADLATIAQLISSNTNITSDTAEVTVTLNGATKTLGVGDTTTVDGKTVRILGFNHDTLTTSTAYGSATATGKAGISFEYVDFVTSSYQAMNSAGTNTNGWAAMPLRTTLNGTVYDSLSIKNYIKAVNKEYITTYNTGAKSTCSDKLWLLSCGEIWNNGYNGGNTRGYAMATEGSQYKYYKSTLGSTAYNTSTNITKKPNASNSYYWWLRSPNFYDSYTFCVVFSSGYCASSYAYYSFGVAPGFSI